MRDIKIRRAAVKIAALDAELRAALGARVAGISVSRVGADDDIIVHLTDLADDDDAAIAADLVGSHDGGQLTDDERHAAHRASAFGTLLGSAIGARTPNQMQTYLDGEIDNWATLADARRDLKAWLPIMAAAIVYLVREE